MLLPGDGPAPEAADHVTASNLDDGVAQAIDRYVLPAAQATKG